jgi:hypothetical protein
MSDSSRITVNYFCLGALLIFVGSVLLCALGFTVVLPYEATRAWPQVLCSVVNSSYDTGVCSCDEQLNVFDTCVSKYPCLQVYVTYTSASSSSIFSSTDPSTTSPTTLGTPTRVAASGHDEKNSEDDERSLAGDNERIVIDGLLRQKRTHKTSAAAAAADIRHQQHLQNNNDLANSSSSDGSPSNKYLRKMTPPPQSLVVSASTSATTQRTVTYRSPQGSTTTASKVAAAADIAVAVDGGGTLRVDDATITNQSSVGYVIRRTKSNQSHSRSIPDGSSGSTRSRPLDGDALSEVETPLQFDATATAAGGSLYGGSETWMFGRNESTRKVAKLYRSWDDSFHSECSLTECGDDVWNVKEARRFKSDWGQVGQTFACFYNPARPQAAIIERMSPVAAIHAVVWPCLLLAAGISLWIGLCLGCWSVTADAVYNDEYSGLVLR